MAQEQASTNIPAHWGMSFTKTTHRTPNKCVDPNLVWLDDGYTVVITGSGKGIGEHIARAYAQAGASNLILTARTATDLERVKGEVEKIAAGRKALINVMICAGDIVDPHTSKRIAQLLEMECGGRLDCLVNNAGAGTRPSGWEMLVLDTEPEEFIHATMLNYVAHSLSAKYLVPLMLNPQSRGRTLINITSGASHLITGPQNAYNIAKLALNRLTETIAAAHADKDLLCVALHPGCTPTEGTNGMPDWMRTILTDDVRLGGAACVWLSHERPLWLSGRYVSATWDFEELVAMKDEIVEKDKLKFRMAV